MPRESGDGSFLRRLNHVAVLRSLHDVESATLAGLARQAQISRATAEGIMEILLRDGWAEELTAGRRRGSAAGRRGGSRSGRRPGTWRG